MELHIKSTYKTKAGNVVEMFEVDGEDGYVKGIYRRVVAGHEALLHTISAWSTADGRWKHYANGIHDVVEEVAR